MLRPYQQEAFDNIIGFISKSFDPCLLEAATGSGKSHIVAAVADWIHDKSGKKVLCLAPSKELTEQNYQKFLATGKPASFYSASLGKSLTHDVVFGTPKTVLNGIKKFGSNFSAIIIDEAHGITPTVKSIVEEIKKQNEKVRIIGLTATPYRLGSGYIFKFWPNGDKNNEEEADDPYFHTLVKRITADELIAQNFLTKPAIHDHDISYDASGLEVNSMGRFNAQEVERAFVGRGRLTSRIVNEVVQIAQNRKGVIIFASTINHANEIMESLPPENSRIVTGKTSKKEREQTIASFKNQRFKYLVNVAVLTTGFDATHIDVVVLMRATESVGLLQQIIGRGLRLHDNKPDCLILDYAENIERHCPDGDIFAPIIQANKKSGEKLFVKAECEECGFENEFSARPNPDKFNVDNHGYFLDLAGKRIETENDQPIPAHHGRRCENEYLIAGRHVRCDSRWSSKECPDCGVDNDIAARECNACGCEIVDPNEKLKLEFERIKLDPKSMSTDEVISWKIQKWMSNAGNQTVKIDFITPYAKFPVWFSPRVRRDWDTLCICTVGRTGLTVDDYMSMTKNKPNTITSKKDGKYYKVYGFNKKIDKDPSL